MDITRLPLAPPGRPAPASPQVTPAARVEAVARADATRARADEPRERVVEGELLQRRSMFWQSTRSFIDERNLEKAHLAGEAVSSQRQSRLAVTMYISNVGAEPRSGPVQGHSLDYFV